MVNLLAPHFIFDFAVDGNFPSFPAAGFIGFLQLVYFRRFSFHSVRFVVTFFPTALFRSIFLSHTGRNFLSLSLFRLAAWSFSFNFLPRGRRSAFIASIPRYFCSLRYLFPSIIYSDVSLFFVLRGYKSLIQELYRPAESFTVLSPRRQ